MTLCTTITELCNFRNVVAHCEVVNNTYICFCYEL